MDIQCKSLDFMGYPKYRVSDDGKVWRWLVRRKTWKLIKGCDDGFRLILNLVNENGCKTYSVHRLILLAFVGSCPKGMECCHNDGNYENNELTNLRWDDHSGNERDKERHGTGNQGVRNRSAKLTVDEVREIRELYNGGYYSMSQLARKYGITLGTICPLI